MANLIDREAQPISPDPWSDRQLVDFENNGEQALAANGTSFVLRIPHTVDVAEIDQSLLNQASAIALEFPAFTDGRAYSQARMLRERGYAGEIRATGDVLPDQLLAMRRCGFSTFELAEGQRIETAQRSLEAFRVAAQPAFDNSSLREKRQPEAA